MLIFFVRSESTNRRQKLSFTTLEPQARYAQTSWRCLPFLTPCMAIEHATRHTCDQESSFLENTSHSYSWQFSQNAVTQPKTVTLQHTQQYLGYKIFVPTMGDYEQRLLTSLIYDDCC